MSGEKEAAPPAAEERVADASELALNEAAKVCLHCVSHGGLPTTFVGPREPEQKRRAACVVASQVLKPVQPFVVFFTPAFAARQNAPPGTASRRHLLLGVFLV